MKNLILVTAASLGLVASASAQSMPATASLSGSLLGQNYVGTEFTYVHYDKGLPKLARDYGLTFNQALTTGLDLGVSYDYLRATQAGVSYQGNTASLNLTGYLDQGWGKPFLMGSGGWTWVNNGSVKQHSYAYAFTTGVEFPVGPSVAVAPFVNYAEAPRIAGAHDWNYGVKTNYRISKEWSTNFTVSIDNEKDMSYGIGVNYHF
ncbi:MAG TPA: hypothetical protein VMC06_06030 [Opitutaceae bacterium]|nr:hypothetical protein [Opitutaceae bacterium]